MNPYPSSHPKVQGGFSPLKGIGDLYSDLGIDSTLTQVGTYVAPSTSSLPTWVYVMGGIAFVAIFLLPPGRARG